MGIPPVTAIRVPPVNAAAPMIPPRLHLAHGLSLDRATSLDFFSFRIAIAEQATMISMDSCKKKIVYSDKKIMVQSCKRDQIVLVEDLKKIIKQRSCQQH